MTMAKKDGRAKGPVQQTLDTRDEQDIEVEELHCGKCGRMLLFYAIVEGTIQVKCKSCKMWTRLDVSDRPLDA